MRLSFRALTFVGAVVVALHNTEEAVAMPTWLATRGPGLAARVGIPQEAIPTIDHLYMALVLVTVIPSLVFLAGGVRPTNPLALYGCVAVSAILFLNALSHMLLASLLWSYTPGVVTAVAVNLPYTTTFLRRSLAEGYAVQPHFRRAFVAGAVLYPITLLLLVPQHGW
jgi:hypothetical protein